MTEPIRPAATVVLWRPASGGAQVLMGQRGAGSAFMPSKYVFPGGGVDPQDHEAALGAGWLSHTCRERLELGPIPAATLLAAALRELHEETGLSMNTAPGSAAMRFIFRAITPPGRTRRFDARFFLGPAARAGGDLEGFAGASGELSHLHWIGLTEARALDLPFITEVVLSEVAALLGGGDEDPHQAGVPFFDNSGPVPTFRRLA